MAPMAKAATCSHFIHKKGREAAVQQEGLGSGDKETEVRLIAYLGAESHCHNSAQERSASSDEMEILPSTDSTPDTCSPVCLITQAACDTPFLMVRMSF